MDRGSLETCKGELSDDYKLPTLRIVFCTSRMGSVSPLINSNILTVTVKMTHHCRTSGHATNYRTNILKASLSYNFRRRTQLYANTFGLNHPIKSLLSESPYGDTGLGRERVKGLGIFSYVDHYFGSNEGEAA